MTKSRTVLSSLTSAQNPTLALAVVALILLPIGCADHAHPHEPDQEAVESAPPAEEVSYEPAYPDEVSEEELTDGDSDQQEAHSHGEDGDHTHGEDSDHTH